MLSDSSSKLQLTAAKAFGRPVVFHVSMIVPVFTSPVIIRAKTGRDSAVNIVHECVLCLFEACRHPMNRLLTPHRLCLLLLLLPLACPAASPNIVGIMAYDLGWMDLNCQGNAKLDTPALDQLAAEGMRFTDAYAASPVCSPTRAAMMTGQSLARLRLTNHAPGHPDGFALEGSTLQEAQNIRHLPHSAVTIAERLFAAGYASAHVGKWHLSYEPSKGNGKITARELYPDRQGFERNMSGESSGGPRSYFSPYKNPTLPDGPDGEYLPERLADEAIAFIREPRDGPFSLNWWPYSVHYPMQAREELIEKYRQRGDLKDPPLFTESQGFERDSLYWHYPNYAFHKQNRLGSAIREGPYKLIKYDDDDSLQLYDLSQDIGEKKNLATQSPELAARLAAKLESWLRETDTKLPVKVTTKAVSPGTKK